MQETPHGPRVIRIEDYSPALSFVFWILGFVIVFWILLTQTELGSIPQTAGMGIAVVTLLWVLLTSRGLVVDLDQVSQKVVRHRIGLWGTKYDDEVQEIPFRTIECVKLKRTTQGFGRGSYHAYQVRVRVAGGDPISLIKPEASLVEASNKAIATAAAIGLEQPLMPVD